MAEFKDIFESEVTIEESENDQVLAKIKFPWARADKANKNNRTYPFEIFKTAVEKLSEKIKRAFIPGQTDHPILGGSTRLGDVSHILKSVWMKDKVAYAEADILKTTKGKDVLRVIKSGVSMGASLRGFGEIGSDGKVKKGLEITTVDLVANPSFGADAEITQANVMESTILEPITGCGELSLEEKKMAGVFAGKRRANMENKIRQKATPTELHHYQEYVSSGGVGDFAYWKNKTKGVK